MFPMQRTMVNGEEIEYTVQGFPKGEAVMLIHESVFADAYLSCHNLA